MSTASGFCPSAVLTRAVVSGGRDRYSDDGESDARALEGGIGEDLHTGDHRARVDHEHQNLSVAAFCREFRRTGEGRGDTAAEHE